MKSGPCLNIKTVFPRYGDSYVKDKMVPIRVRRHLFIETAPSTIVKDLIWTNDDPLPWPIYVSTASMTWIFCHAVSLIMWFMRKTKFFSLNFHLFPCPCQFPYMIHPKTLCFIYHTQEVSASSRKRLINYAIPHKVWLIQSDTCILHVSRLFHSIFAQH